MNGAVPQAGKKQDQGFEYEVRTLDEHLDTLLERWRKSNEEFGDHTLHCDPDWLAEQYKAEKPNVRAFFLTQGDSVRGVVPGYVSMQPLLCQVGDVVVAKPRLKTFRFLGYNPNLPDDYSAYDMLFKSIMDSDADAVFMNYVKADSFFWSYLQSSPLVKKYYRLHCSRGAQPHLVIRLKGTFDEYMQKFSSKTRKNRLREIKKLRDRGDMQFIRVTDVKDVESFMKDAGAISEKTWQHKRLGWGLAAWGLNSITANMKFMAEKGWLRSYLLKLGDVPVAFILGQQYRGRYYHGVIGFDPEYSNLSVGTVLQLLTLEDLFGENPPDVYDLGTHADYKEYFSNESYPERIVWLFRRKPYPTFAYSLFRWTSRASVAAGSMLNKFGLKAKVKQLLRGQK